MKLIYAASALLCLFLVPMPTARAGPRCQSPTFAPGSDESIGSLPDHLLSTAEPDFSGVKLTMSAGGPGVEYWFVHHSLKGQIDLKSAIETDQTDGDGSAHEYHAEWKSGGLIVEVSVFQRIYPDGHIEDLAITAQRFKEAVQELEKVFPRDDGGQTVGALIPRAPRLLAA